MKRSILVLLLLWTTLLLTQLYLETFQNSELETGFWLSYALTEDLADESIISVDQNRSSIKDTPVIVGGDYKFLPYEGLDRNNNPTGLNVELMRAIASRTGLEVEFRYEAWTNVINGLLEGEIDIVPMFKTEERLALFDFSEPFTLVFHSVYIRDDPPPVRYMTDLVGKTIILQEDAAPHFYFRNFTEYDLIMAASEPEALLMLSEGYGDCAIATNIVGSSVLKDLELDKIITTGPPILPSVYCFAVRKGNRALLALINEGLTEVRASGEYDSLRDKWLTVVELEKPGMIRVIRYALWILAPLLILAAILILWTLTLRRVVKEKTKDLQKELNERLIAEAHLRRINILNDVLSSVYHTIIRVKDKDKLVTEICEKAFCGQIFTIFWIGSYDRETNKIIPLGVNGCDIEEIRNLIGEAFIRKIFDFGIDKPEHINLPYFVNDKSSRLFKILDKEFVARHKIRSFAFLPLYKSNEFFGITSFFSTEENYFGQDELRLIMEVAQDISFALTILEQEQEKQLLEEQLQIAQKMESFGQLASGIAHDFNNVLSIILGSTTLMNDKSTEPELRKYLDIIEDAAKRGSDLAHRLLAFAGRRRVKSGLFNVNELLEEVFKTLQHTIGKEIILQIKNPEDKFYMQGDSNQLFQVILNLCVNARDALMDPRNKKKEKDIRIKYDLAKPAEMTKKFFKVPKRDYLKVSVMDNGTGIPPDLQKKVFEPFFTTKEEGKGTGLGLSMAFQIINSFGGYLNLESEVGSGTTFHIYFPVEKNVRIDEPVTQESVVSQESDTLLLVEDDEVLQDLIYQILTSAGYEVLRANDGVEGLEKFKENQERIAVVISDVSLPRVSGVELYKKILEMRPETNFILISGYLEQDLDDKLEKRPATLFLDKPFKMTILQESIQKLLDG